jgi:16S rRNA (cytidine1402-2'-O)-methyltransferase
MPGSVYVVATPIGNLEDLSYRAARILGEVSAIAAEDTRQTSKLLNHFRISTRLISCHEHNEQARTGELLDLVRAGSSIAIVTDAGTPLISDPGYRLVRSAIEAGIAVVPIPGPSAGIAALSASGLPADQFWFAGFVLPKSSQRRRMFEELRERRITTIFHEAPHRIVETLADAEAVLGPDRPIVVARELTKIHEEFLRGPLTQVRRLLAERPSVKGEITLLIGPAPDRAPAEVEPSTLRAEIDSLVAAGMPKMEAVKEIARKYGLPKREVYRLAG